VVRRCLTHGVKFDTPSEAVETVSGFSCAALATVGYLRVIR